MPRYDYKCPECRHVVEVSCPIEERDWPVVCTECEEYMVRQFSPTAFQIEGKAYIYRAPQWADAGDL